MVFISIWFSPINLFTCYSLHVAWLLIYLIWLTENTYFYINFLFNDLICLMVFISIWFSVINLFACYNLHVAWLLIKFDLIECLVCYSFYLNQLYWRMELNSLVLVCLFFTLNEPSLFTYWNIPYVGQDLESCKETLSWFRFTLWINFIFSFMKIKTIVN